MSELDGLERFLRTDPGDVGCDGAMAVLHVYVDLVASEQDAAERMRGSSATQARPGSQLRRSGGSAGGARFASPIGAMARSPLPALQSASPTGPHPGAPKGATASVPRAAER